MTLKGKLYLSVAAVSIAGCIAFSQLGAQTAIPIKKTDIGGVVTGPNGPEAGVWVIAETHDLPTRFAKMVVTDDQGRYVVPDLPKAKYTVWVRGYGLADSAKVEAEPGKQLNLKAVPAANAAEAAKVLSGDLLVFDAEDSRRRSVRRPQRHSGQGQADRLAQRHEEQRLRRLPSARQARHAHAAEGTRRIQNLGRSLGAPRAIRPGRPADGQLDRRRSGLDADQIFRRVDRPHRRRRVAARTNRSGRKASSATSSSPRGIGPTTSITCTTRFRPTSATRRSTAMVRCSARRNTPPTSFRFSIR